MSAAAEPVWTPTDSSNVKSVAWNEATKVLGVEFNHGFYTYDGVEEEHYKSLVHAESVGKYLNSVIKATYPYHKHDTVEELRSAVAA